jgi:WD40 repeat protein
VAPVPLSERVVEVIVDRGEKVTERHSYGSGCIVNGRTVLTAAHVVAGAVSVHVRGLDKEVLSASIDQAFVGDPGEWRGDAAAQPDLALVTIDDERVDFPRMGYAQVDRDHRSGVVERVRAVGYPWFAHRKVSKTVRVPVDVRGQILLLSHAVEGLLSVQVTVRPRAPGANSAPASQWSGMSGAPVLVAGRLVGVVSEHAPREGDATITVVPLTALEPHPDYPKWGGGVADPAAWWQRLGADGLDDLVVVPAPEEAEYWATMRQFRSALHARMPVLLGREQEIQDIEAFSTGNEPYRWLIGGAFSGKSALLYTSVTSGLPDNVDAVCYFLSRRASDADGNRFLSAVVPQLEVLVNDETPRTRTPDLDRFRALWEKAASQAAADARHVLLVVDGLDEDLQPPGAIPVVKLLPTLTSDHAHVLVSSRPHSQIADVLPPDHPMATCPRVDIQPFAGAAELAELARAEIDALVTGPDADDVSIEVLGLLTAAAGPLSAWDLAVLYTGLDKPRALDVAHVRTLLEERAARSLEAVGPPDQPRYQFAHVTLSDYARDDDYLSDPEYRERIHAWADRWKDAGWPSPIGERTGTPRYLLDTYPATLRGDANFSRLFPEDGQRLVQIAGDIDWVTSGVCLNGADATLATLRVAATLALTNATVVDLDAVVSAQARNLHPPDPIGDRSYVLRQLCLQALHFDMTQLADACRQRLLGVTGAGLIPETVTMTTIPPDLELGSHQKAVWTVESSNGHVFTSGDDGRIRMWDLENPGFPTEVGQHPDYEVRALDVLPDTLVSGGTDGRVVLWDVSRHSPRDSIELGKCSSPITALAALSDDQVVSGDGDGHLRIWHTDKRSEPIDLGKLAGAVLDLDVRQEDSRVVTGGADWRVSIWDFESPSGPTPIGRHDGKVFAVLFLRDGRVASGGADGAVRLWNTSEPDLDSPLELGQHAGQVWALAEISGNRLMSSGQDELIRIWDLNGAKAPIALGRHVEGAIDLEVIRDRHVVSAGMDGRVRVWSLDSQGLIGNIAQTRPTVTALLLLGNDRVLTGDRAGQLLLWEAVHNQEPTNLGQHDGLIWTIGLLPEGGVVSLGRDNRVRSWSTDQEMVAQPLGDQRAILRAISILLDGRVLTNARGDRIPIGSLEAGAWFPPMGSATDPTWIVLASNDDRFITVHDDGCLRICSSTDLTKSTELGSHGDEVGALAQMPGGLLVTGGEDGRLLMWNMTQRADPVEIGVLDAPIDLVKGVDDQRLVTRDLEGNARLWHLQRPRESLHLGGSSGRTEFVVVLSSRRLATASETRVELWDPLDPANAVAVLATPVTGLSGNSQGPNLPRLAIAHGESGVSTWTVRTAD